MKLTQFVKIYYIQFLVGLRNQSLKSSQTPRFGSGGIFVVVLFLLCIASCDISYTYHIIFYCYYQRFVDI